MVYENPELRLVGAAQNLVLGESESPVQPPCGRFGEVITPQYNISLEW